MDRRSYSKSTDIGDSNKCRIRAFITSLWESPMYSDREEDRRSVLATIGQLRESLVLSARDEEAPQAVAAGLRDAKAANTRRVYASAWHEFNVWALANGRQSLPAEPQTVALYLGRLAAAALRPRHRAGVGFGPW